MRFGVRGVSVGDFEETELPGRLQISVVPEPMPEKMLNDYVAQFRAWIVGNGLRELVETYSQFLDQVYAHGLEVLSPTDLDRRQHTFEQVSLRDKIQRLRAEMGIDGGFSQHLESLTIARNALTHGTGRVRPRDCTDGGELVITWRGIECFFTDDDGVRHRIGDEPPEVRLRDPLESVTVDRQRRWKLGQRVELTAFDLTEICYMANHDSIDVLEGLRAFGASRSVNMVPAKMIRGGSDDTETPVP